MRRITWAAAIMLVFSLVLSACGTKDAESVVKELDKVVNGMESYSGTGKMTLYTGQQPLEYNVEVSYQKPQYYRIKLTNAEKDITQIVLRNDDGVFVLTPRLNKVFRFQSDWPQNQGQVYLYQTLVQSILNDNSRQFVTDENAYVFDVMANYNNGSLARQKIWLNKSDYKPVHVEVSDANAAVMVKVDFDKFEFGSKFDKSVFETEANMQSSPSSSTEDETTMTEPENNGEVINDSENAATPENPADDEAGSQAENDNGSNNSGANNTTSGNAANEEETSAQPDSDLSNELLVMAPTYLGDGVTWKDSADIDFGGNPGILTRYTGTHDYTLIQTQPHDQAVSYANGLLIDLGFTIGELQSGEVQQTLTWTYEGNQFRLTSATLPESEMIKIAQSVQASADK
ncbi:MAG: outer membrane lipoprotein carrier protein LolA [Candidatus Pristimantibacillus sp.]